MKVSSQEVARAVTLLMRAGLVKAWLPTRSSPKNAVILGALKKGETWDEREAFVKRRYPEAVRLTVEQFEALQWETEE